MLKLVKGILVLLGGTIQDVERAGSAYEPQHGGTWVTTKKHGIEDITWKELNPEPKMKQYVSVFDFDGDYVITVGNHPRPNAIEVTECDYKSHVPLTIEILEAGYSVKGNVIISQEESHE